MNSRLIAFAVLASSVFLSVCSKGTGEPEVCVQTICFESGPCEVLGLDEQRCFVGTLEKPSNK